MKTASVQILHHKKTIPTTGADMDTKHLLKKGKCWYLNFTFPKSFTGKLAGKKVRISLQTPEFKVAKAFRDRYILRLLTFHNSLEALKELSKNIADLEPELLKEVEKILPHLKIRSVSSSSSVSLEKLSEEYLDYLQNKSGRKLSSIMKYRASLDCFCYILGKDTSAEGINHEHIRYFVDNALKLPRAWSYKKKEKLEDLLAKEWPNRLSNNSVRGFLILAKQMFDWGIETECLSMPMPFKRLNTYLQENEKEHKRPPTVEEADEIMELKQPRQIGVTEWSFIPLIGRYTGMRLAEICQLHAEDILVQDGVICFKVCRDVKTKSSTRLVPVSFKIINVIQNLKAQVKTGRLFPNCGDRESGGNIKYGHEFSKRFNRAVKKIHPELTFHGWRVYANTEMAKASVGDIDRERLLGHKNRTTNAVYLAEDLKRYRKAIDKIT